MTINIHTNISNATHIEIEKNSKDHITVWITHDGELHGIWLKDISPNFTLELNGVKVGKQTKARRYLFSHKTRDKAITLLKAGAFTRKQIASFLGLKDSSVYTLITDIRQEHTIERSGKWGSLRYTIAS
tara:strand:+ start:326 stop:712 length:387 start_codon:yes stop_codon:yes gene_type:complete